MDVRELTPWLAHDFYCALADGPGGACSCGLNAVLNKIDAILRRADECKEET